ncbi:Fur family transcriptional regulator [Pectinatus sottacetonis]|uniref:Fur family transcriptional regulator n=1 Tax=Pectinatus sottacetonis TaxID=1002795 RepID=UPI0018C6CDB6|nr:Fur family transcriptional regulator [Pectinatus sottacetonis]
MLKNTSSKIMQKFTTDGHRLTAQRRIILEIITAHAHEHMTINDIYKYALENNDNISLITVYRIVNFLTKNNILRRVQIDSNHYCYELIEHSNLMSYPHFICQKCGKVFDLGDEDTIKKLSACEQKIAATYHFKIKYSEILYYGLCKNCLDTEE